MPKRIFFALVATLLMGMLPNLGNAQGISMGRSKPLSPASAAPAAPAAAPGYPAGMYAPGGAYPASPYPGGYPAAAAPFGETSGQAADPNRKLLAGDQLLLKIDEDREAAVAVSVAQTGDVIVDPLPQTVHIAGMTLPQASNEIKRQLEKDYYYTATVRLTLERAGAAQVAMVMISGYVNRVGPIQLIPNRVTTLSQVIGMAGGFARYANDRKVRVTRRNKDGSTQVFIVDCKRIIQEGKLDGDMVMQDGDNIFVPDTFIKS